jgi:hypothetical protein
MNNWFWIILKSIVIWLFALFFYMDQDMRDLLLNSNAFSTPIYHVWEKNNWIVSFWSYIYQQIECSCFTSAYLNFCFRLVFFVLLKRKSTRQYIIKKSDWDKLSVGGFFSIPKAIILYSNQIYFLCRTYHSTLFSDFKFIVNKKIIFQIIHSW